VKLALWFGLLFASSAHALMGGQIAKDPRYNAVGAIVCTATLISERWVVTTQHCREGGSEEEPMEYKPSQLQFILGENTRASFMRLDLKTWIDAPFVDGGAFIELTRELNDQRIEPIPLSVNIEKKSSTDVFEVVGLGMDSDDYYYAKKGLRKKAQFTITTQLGNAFDHLFDSQQAFFNYLQTFHSGEEELIERHWALGNLTSDYTIHAWDHTGRSNLANITEPENGWADTCFADSGGPLLRKSVDGQLELVAITMRGFPGMTRACVPLGTVMGVFGPKFQEIMDEHSIPYLRGN
jgi:V8-like Glu-specific endopeptidase